jgi:hypothetical protein
MGSLTSPRICFGLYSTAFCFVMARRWEGGAIMHRPDCIAGFRHVLLYPYFEFDVAKIPHSLLQGGRYSTVFGGADILLITVHATE